MIENQLPPMPPRQGRQHGCEQRQQQSMRQNRLWEIEPQPPIGADNGNQSHRRDGMVPARDPHANAWHSEQFGRSDHRSEHTKRECDAGGPDAHAQPEHVAGQPIDAIDAKRADYQRNREMDQHGVNGMASDRNRRANILVGNSANAGIGVVSARLGRRLFHSDFYVFRFGLGHLSPSILKYAALAATPAALTGCAAPLSTLDPAGPAAANIATLWWVMFWGAVVLFVLVLSLLALSFIRPRAIAAIKPIHWTIGGGLIMPVPILIALVVAALLLGEQLLPKPGRDAPMRIEAHASRWQWQFSYPDTPGAIKSETLHLPAGEPVDIVLTAEDVIHSFWVPRLGGKLDAIPGHTNVIRLEADKPGTYRGICAEYCGEGHETMGFIVEAHAPADYAAAIGGTP